MKRTSKPCQKSVLSSAYHQFIVIVKNLCCKKNIAISKIIVLYQPDLIFKLCSGTLSLHKHYLDDIYPIKLTTMRCKMTWAKIKSAKPRSGEMLRNWFLFAGFTWSLRHTPRMKEATQEMNPLKNALNGKVPTRQQYTNWKTPVKKM